MKLRLVEGTIEGELLGDDDIINNETDYFSAGKVENVSVFTKVREQLNWHGKTVRAYKWARRTSADMQINILNLMGEVIKIDAKILTDDEAVDSTTDYVINQYVINESIKGKIWVPVGGVRAWHGKTVKFLRSNGAFNTGRIFARPLEPALPSYEDILRDHSYCYELEVLDS